MTLKELVASFDVWAKTNLAEGTRQEYARQFKRFDAASGHIPVEQMKPIHLLSWADTWHKIQACQRLFNWAADVAEIIPRNPFKKIARPAIGERKRVLDRKQMLRMFRHAASEFRAFLVFMRETLARPQEVRGFSWEQLVWNREKFTLEQALVAGAATIVLEDFKARKRRRKPSDVRVIPVSTRLGRLIFRCASRATSLSGPILLNQRGHAWTNNAVRLRMKRLRSRCGLGKADHRGEKVVCYTLRHSMATLAAAMGIRDKVLSESMGHTSTRTTARYQHLDIDHIRDAIEKLSQSHRRRSG